MKKTIKIINNGEIEYKEVTVDEVLEMFQGMCNEFANKCIHGLDGYKDASQEFQDYRQIAMMKAVYVFEKYDIERNACFSRALFEGLKNQYIDLIKRNEAKKRRASKHLLSHLADCSRTETQYSSVVLHGVPDHYFKEDDTELEEFLKKKLSKEEMVYLTMVFKKQLGKASSVQKDCLLHTIDSFAKVIGETVDSKAALSKQLGISRPTINTKMKEVALKVKILTSEFYAQAI